LLGTYSTINILLRRVLSTLLSLIYILCVTDLIKQMSQLLRAELEELVDVAQAMMEPIKLCDKEW